MKSQLVLLGGLLLVLCSFSSRAASNAPEVEMSLAVGGKTNINQTTIHRTMNWTNRNVRLFYSTGEPPRTLPAREANFEIPAGPVHRQGASFDIVAFADPANRLV